MTNCRLTGGDSSKKNDEHTLTYCSNVHKDMSFNATQADPNLDLSIAEISPDNTQRDFMHSLRNKEL